MLIYTVIEKNEALLDRSLQCEKNEWLEKNSADIRISRNIA